MTKATAIYVRVSHRDQKHASQLPDLERWAANHDGDVVWASINAAQGHSVLKVSDLLGRRLASPQKRDKPDRGGP